MLRSFHQYLAMLVDQGVFHRCGENPELSGTFLTWPTVVSMVSDESWGSFLNERSNDLRRHVRSASVERYDRWNSFSAPARNSWRDAIQKIRVRTNIDDNTWAKVEGTVGWYLVLAAVEEAYADLGGPDWHRQMCDWLCQGYFPCGWEGKFPKGNPIIY